MLFQIDDLKSTSNGAVDALSCYHFRLDYRKVQANAAADALSCYPPRSQTEDLSSLTLSSFILLISSLTLWVSLFRTSLFGSYSSKPHLFGSSHSFNPILTAPDPCLRNTHPVLATSVVRRVSKRASRRPHKTSVGGVWLRLQGL